MEVKKVTSKRKCGCDQSTFEEAAKKRNERIKSAVEINSKEFVDDQKDISKRKRNRF